MMIVSILIMLGALADGAYSVDYTSCGIEHQVDQIPERVITMTQGATEFMLALGLHDRMVGTAYLDDYIWPAYEAEYSKIPVLSSSYPNESTIMNQNPDFIVASFNSAFRQMYTTDAGKVLGIFSNATGVAPCAGIGGEELGISDIPSNQLTCRRELNSMGVGTFLFQDACENQSLRPEEVSETTVYEEMRTLGKIFNVSVEHVITDMSQDFDTARNLVSASMGGTPLKTVWLDCVGRCCQVDDGEEPEVYVGAGDGVPHMLMQEAGLTNVFAQTEGNWACVKESEVINSAPDVIVVVDAAWDSAVGKLTWLYNRTELCDLAALTAARLVQIPFSATCLSPRNGPAALDLAMAALHVRMGTVAASGRSGVNSFDTTFLQTQTEGLSCKLDMTSVVYVETTTTTTDGEEDADTTTKETSKDGDGDEASDAWRQHSAFVWAGLAAAFTYEVHHRSQHQ